MECEDLNDLAIASQGHRGEDWKIEKCTWIDVIQMK